MLLFTVDILEGFDNHPPLILPVDGFVLDLKRPVSEMGLVKQLGHFQRLIKKFPDIESGPDEPSQVHNRKNVYQLILIKASAICKFFFLRINQELYFAFFLSFYSLSPQYQ